MYTQEQQKGIEAVLSTRRMITSKYKYDLLHELGRLIMWTTTNKETAAVLPSSGKRVRIKADLMAEFVQDQVQLYGEDGIRLDPSAVTIDDIHAVIDSLSKIS